ncbi:MAG: MliC family protein [Minisyncoccia bacterium]|jgi:membrane-bound inhibitor of C-type lysozyme
MQKGKVTGVLLIVVIVLIGVFLWYNRSASWFVPFLGSNKTSTEQQETAKVTYACDANKTIVATYYSGPSLPVPVGSTMPPAPNGSVALTLGDGRAMTLPQTISGSGIRYANADESLVFWSKGNTAFITEGLPAQAGVATSSVQTFANCVVLSDISGQDSWNFFASSTLGYSIKYPQGYTMTAPYDYQELGPGKDIAGVKFTIDPAIATGTNLSRDSYVSVEQLPNDAADCTAGLFLDDQHISTSTLTDNGVTYSVAVSNGAGAGNLYSETVYAIPGSSACTAVRYFIHSSEIGNYPPGMVVAFDKQTLLNQFDAIRRSLVLAR